MMLASNLDTVSARTLFFFFLFVGGGGGGFGVNPFGETELLFRR